MELENISGNQASLENIIRQAIVEALTDIDLAPALLRLAFHDAGTYDQSTHTGGANGSVSIRSEMEREANEDMIPAAELLGAVKEQFNEVSWADIIAVGGAAAIEKCQGPVITVGLGRKDSGQEDPDDRLPDEEWPIEPLKATFVRMGLGVKELVVLSGAHTLGEAFEVPFTGEPFRFNNDYFKRVLKGDEEGLALLPSDKALLDDPEAAALVRQFAADEAHFYREFAEAYRKITWLGQEPG